MVFFLQDRESPEVLSRLGSIDRRYQELIELSKLRKQRLEDAAALYQLFNEADGTEQWIAEKVLSKSIPDIAPKTHLVITARQQ